MIDDTVKQPSPLSIKFTTDDGECTIIQPKAIRPLSPPLADHDSNCLLPPLAAPFVAAPLTPPIDREDCNPLTVASSEEAVITDDADDSNVSEPGSVMLTSSTDSSVSSSPLIQSSTLFFTKKSLQSAIQSDSITGQRRLLVVINGKVCDLTRFASQHPGGPLVIEHMVGRDATDVFTAFHPPSVAKLISGYSIGEWVEFPGDGPIDASLSLPSLVAAKLIGADTAMHTGNAADETAEMRSKRISNNYRQFNIQLREKGFYQVNPWFYYRRFALFAVLLSLALYTIMSAPDSLLNLTIGGLVLGFVWHGLSFSVHDLAHHSGFGNSKTDHTIAIFLASFVGGLSAGWWGYNHNTHHVVTNDVHHDPDIQHMPFIAISTRFFDGLYSSFHKRVLKFDLAARLLTSIQHYSFLPVLSFGRFNLYAQSIGFLINNPTRNPYRWLEITGISVFWLWFGYGLLLNVIPTWPLRLFLLYLSHGATMILHLQITLSHFAMDTTDAPPHETFAELGVRTTMNVDCPQWMDWFHGGLQFQIEHHLFPRIPRCHFRSLAPLVRQFCKENGLTYHAYSFFNSNGLVRGVLKEVADQVKLLWRSADVDIRYKSQ